MGMAQKPDTLPGPQRLLAHKIRLSSGALLFERVWPRLWLVFGIAALFILVSLLGVWSWLSPIAHRAALAAFGLAALASLVFVVRVARPTRDEALRRIEQRSAVPHRPASSYEDTLSSPTTDPATQSIWRAHKDRLARQIDGLKVGTPAPRTDRHDPIALRAALALLVGVGLALVGDSARDRIALAFSTGWRTGPAGANGSTARLDAWVAPPAYTTKPPIILVDGNDPTRKPPALGASGAIEVPQRSQLIARASGSDGPVLSFEIETKAGVKTTIKPQPTDGKDLSEVSTALMTSGRVRILDGSRQVASFTFDVTPDFPPSGRCVAR